jgi:hypothetical protein
MITSVSTWRCKCGIRIKVIGESDPANAGQTVKAACPKCGDEQVINAMKLVSITTDNEQPEISDRFV